MISEIYYNFKVVIYKQLQNKNRYDYRGQSFSQAQGNPEIFCMADDFCNFFDVMVVKYTLKPTGK
ncbi:MAG: transposase [Hoylesella buccalis]